MTLTILCVTDGQPHALPFIDGMEQLAADLDAEFVEYDGTCAGCIERVLDDAVAECPDGYILRLDDDERPDTAMIDWLAERSYEQHDHWAFPRFNLYPDADTYIVSHNLYPDLQTRLSVKRKAGGRNRIHVGSPFGTGAIAHVHIEHHKFLVRTLEERYAILEQRELMQPGAGLHFTEFSIPEKLDQQLVCTVSRAEAIV